ncbi:ATP synthase subunit I [Congregibacter variabilis]|uniref:ATP synthase subunit I n=1 Tax=Congregibacter variabilis TaxID=3081200 RepID=A0ABZ0I0V6_9GAMM|nr:ATP synthase subunit I [Congregibacter sp. IMCC43200]
MAQDRVREQATQATRKTPPRPQYLRTTLIQLLLLLIGAPIVYWAAGLVSASSMAYGALCSVLPQAYFAVRVTVASKHSAQQAARAGLAAEGGKFVLSAVCFALVFAVLKPEQPGLVFLGFGVFWVIQVGGGIRLLRDSR